MTVVGSDVVVVDVGAIVGNVTGVDSVVADVVVVGSVVVEVNCAVLSVESVVADVVVVGTVVGVAVDGIVVDDVDRDVIGDCADSVEDIRVG